MKITNTILVIALMFFSCENSTNYYILEDEKLVLEIAKDVIEHEYNKPANLNAPYTVTRVGNVWIVKGSIPKNTLGGIPIVKIETNGRIIEVVHSK